MLAHDICVTPAFTRVSRMIRDISAQDIIAGSKKTNLRQMVEASKILHDQPVHEIRYREIAGEEVDTNDLRLDEVAYETTNTSERFFQWVTPQGKIVGFLRLSLPHAEYMTIHASELPEELGYAMIREVHVYGQVAEPCIGPMAVRSTWGWVNSSSSGLAPLHVKRGLPASTSSVPLGRVTTIASSASWMARFIRRGTSSRQIPTCGLLARV